MNLQQIKDKLNEELKEANKYIIDRGANTLQEIMKWDLQNDQDHNDIFDAGFIGGLNCALKLIEKAEKENKPNKVYICKNCGTQRTNPFPESEETYDKYCPDCNSYPY